MGEKTRKLGQPPAGVGPITEHPAPAAEPTAPTVDMGKTLDEILEAQGLLDEHAPNMPPEMTVADDQGKPNPSSFSVRKVGVDLIDVSPYQPRKEFDPEKLSLLADAIQASGLLNPILLRPSPNTAGRFELVGGERRWRAFQLLNWSEIDARIKEMSDAEAEVNALTDNEGDALSDYERARAFQSMLARNTQWNMAALSRHVGVSKATITRCMSYFKLPEGVLEILEGQPRIIGTRAVADFAAFEKQHDDLVVEGISMIVDGKTSQQGSLRWIKRQIQNRINPAGPKPTPNHLVANGEVLGRIKVKGNCVEIVCESGVNVSNLADLLKELLSTQTIPKGEPLPE